jgi:phage-related protein
VADTSLEQVIDISFVKFIENFNKVWDTAVTKLVDALSKLNTTPVVQPVQTAPKAPKADEKPKTDADIKTGVNAIGQAVGRIPLVGDVIRVALDPAIKIFETFSKIQSDKKKSSEKKTSTDKTNTTATTQTTSPIPDTSALSSVIERLIAAINSATAAISKGSAPKGTTEAHTLPQPATPNLPGNTPAPAPGGGKGGAGGAGKAAAGAEGGLAEAGAAFAGAAVAVAALAVAVEQAFSKIQSAVAAFSPATIELFNQSLDNFNATVGKAFVPIFQDLTQVVQQATSAIAPLMDQIRPIVQQFADSLGNFLVKYIQQAADRFQAIIPIIDLLAKAFEPVFEIVTALGNVFTLLFQEILLVVTTLLKLSGIGVLLQGIAAAFKIFNEAFSVVREGFNILATVVNTLVDGFLGLFTGLFPIKEIFDSFHKAVQQVIKSLYIFAIQLAKSLGLNSVVGAILKSLEGKNAKGEQAAGPASIQTYESLSKNLALKAASAVGGGSGGGVTSEQDFWKQVLEDAKAAAESTKDFKEIVKDGFKAVVDALPKIPGSETIKAASDKYGKYAPEWAGGDKGSSGSGFLGYTSLNPFS